MNKNQVLSNTDFISVKEASELFYCSYRQIRYWCKKHQKYGLSFKNARKWYLNKNAFVLDQDL